MKEFFKKIGQGFLGIITLPFFLVLLVLGFIVGVFVFIGYLFVVLVRFFRGDNLFPMSEREEKAGEILRERAMNNDTKSENVNTIVQPAPQMAPQIIIIQTGTDASGQPIFSPVANPHYQKVNSAPELSIANTEVSEVSSNENFE